MKSFYTTLRSAAVAVCLLFSLHIVALKIGSDFFTFTQAHIVFTALHNDNNSVSNFSWLKNGFTLQDSLTTATFSSIYPVSGLLDFNGGTLILESDFVLENFINWKSFGTIIGNGFNIDLTLATFAPVLSPTFPTFQDSTLLINGNFTLLRAFHFKGNCTVVGNNNLVTLFDGLGAVVVDPDSTLTLRGVTVANVHGTNMRCTDDTGVLILDNTGIIQTADYSFSTGHLSFLNNVDWQGSFTFLYDSINSSTIQSASVLRMFNGITFSLGRVNDTTLVEPLVFTDATSILSLDTATLHINSHGAQFTKGTFEATGNVTVDVASTSTATALEFGDGNPAHDQLFQFNGGSFTDFTRGTVVWDIASIAAQSPSVTILQDDNSIFYMKQSLLVSTLAYSPIVGSQVQLAPGKALKFQNVSVITENAGTFAVSGTYQPGIGFLLQGNQSILINSGNLPYAVFVNGAGNFLGGAGDIAQPITLLNSAAQLTWALSGGLGATVFMNGGSLFLTSSLTFGHGIYLSGPGTVHTDNQTVNLSELDFTVTDSMYWDGSIGIVNLNSTVNLSNIWTFSDDCILDGNGHVLDLAAGAIVVERGARLKLRNIRLINISGNNIRCLDDASSITYNSASITLSGSYTFTIGSMRCESFVTFQGNGDLDEKFIYQSDKPLIIAPSTSFTFDAGTTFSYDANSPDLLSFFDKTSLLVLNNAMLHTTQHGLNLLHGSLLIEGNSMLLTYSAITLGDCFTGTNDFIINIIANAQLEIAQGDFNYKNVNASSFNALGTSILRTDGGAALNLYTMLDLGVASAVFGNNATLGNQGNLIGSSSQEGVLNIVVLPPC